MITTNPISAYPPSPPPYLDPSARAISPTPSPTLSLSARQVAVSVISIIDNVARVKIGNKFYDADITEHTLDSSGSKVDKKLTMTENIALKVQEHFETLLAQGAFTTDTKEVTLSGQTDFTFTHIKTIDSAGAATTKKINELAPPAIQAVNQLQRYLASQDKVLHSPAQISPATLVPSAPPWEPATGPQSPTPDPVAPAQPAAPKAKTKLTEQFLKRALDSSTNPIDHIKQLYPNADADFETRAAKALAKYLTDGISRPEGYANDPEKLDLIKQELARIAQKDRAGLEEAARDFKKGWLWNRTPVFIPGFTGNMAANGFDSFSPEDLVKLYANYLNKQGISENMSEGFYPIYVQFANDATYHTEFTRSLQMRILKKDKEQIVLQPMHSTSSVLIPSNCIYLLQDGDKFKAYKREAKKGTPPLEALDTLTQDKLTSSS